MILAVNIPLGQPCPPAAHLLKAVEERIPMFTKYMGAALHGQGHYQKSAAMSVNRHYVT